MDEYNPAMQNYGLTHLGFWGMENCAKGDMLQVTMLWLYMERLCLIQMFIAISKHICINLQDVFDRKVYTEIHMNRYQFVESWHFDIGVQKGSCWMKYITVRTKITHTADHIFWNETFVSRILYTKYDCKKHADKLLKHFMWQMWYSYSGWGAMIKDECLWSLQCPAKLFRRKLILS